MSWEYDVELVSIGDSGRFEDWLNQKGSDGWEFVAMNIQQPNVDDDASRDPEALVVFKRQSGQ